MSTELALSFASSLLLSSTSAAPAYAEVAPRHALATPDVDGRQDSHRRAMTAPHKHRARRRSATGRPPTNRPTRSKPRCSAADAATAPTVRARRLDATATRPMAARARARPAPAGSRRASHRRVRAGNGADVAQLSLQHAPAGRRGRPACRLPPRSRPSRSVARQSSGWGASASARSLATEIGNAGIGQPDNGTLIYPFTETRWGFDLRYAIPLGERFLLLPRLGYGHVGYDLERRNQPAPSLCTTTSTQVCLPDVQLSHLTLASTRAWRSHLGGAVAGARVPAGFGLGHGGGPWAPSPTPACRGWRHAGRELAAARLAGVARVAAAHPLQLRLQPPPARVHVGVEDLLRLVVGATVFAR